MSPIKRIIRSAGFESLHTRAAGFIKRKILKMPSVGIFAAVFDEQGRILLVQQNYRQSRWALPGGRLETGETVSAAVAREVREESGYLVRVEHLIGVYSVSSRDDLVLFFRTHILGQGEWKPGFEISEHRFFSQSELPEKIGRYDRQRIKDAFEGRREAIVEFN